MHNLSKGKTVLLVFLGFLMGFLVASIDLGQTLWSNNKYSFQSNNLRWNSTNTQFPGGTNQHATSGGSSIISSSGKVFKQKETTIVAVGVVKQKEAGGIEAAVVVKQNKMDPQATSGAVPSAITLGLPITNVTIFEASAVVDVDYTFFFGTRPEIIKLSPLCKQFSNAKTVFTGQHPDLVRPYLEKNGLSINVQFTNVFEAGQTLVQLTSKLMLAADTLKITNKMVWVVQGDTTTTYAIAYVAFLKNIPVVHIEAGLRTYDMRAPFPEEFNRQSVSLIAAANFAPTAKAAHALYAQGIPKSKVFVVGNTGIDSARLASEKLKTPQFLVDKLQNWNKTLIFMTMHRRENQRRMNQYYDTVAKVVKGRDVRVLVPLHPNPTAKKAAETACETYSVFVCVEPLDYEITQWVLNRAFVVITDSGGLQEEATWYSKPVLVLRRSTERTEAIDAGVSLLAYDFNALESSLSELLAPGSGLMEQMSQRTFPFGDGHAAEKIAKIMRAIDWHATDMKQIKPKLTDTSMKVTIAALDSKLTDTSIVQKVESKSKGKCAISPLRPTDATGSVVHDMMFAWAYAESNGLNYKGPFGQRSNLHELSSVVALFKLPWSLQTTKNLDCKLLDPKAYRNEAILKSTWPSIQNSLKQRTLANTCAVHIRRGDISVNTPMTGDYYRYRDDTYYLRLIKKHCGTLEVFIFSESGGLNLKFWETTGHTLKLSKTIAETWSEMLHSKVLITSASSFSYTPALFAQGTVIYTPFWHKPMTDWTISSPLPSLPWKNVDNSFDIVKKQCEGGQHGSIHPTVSTCILSPSSTIMFQHMPHAAQTLFNCWSLFQHHATEYCNFFFADGLKTTPYANWMIKHMGCSVVEKLPSRCAYVSTYSAELRVKPGDTFSWFHTPEVALRLRQNAFLYLSSRINQNTNIGIIRRKGTRKMILPEPQIEKMTQVKFEDINLDEQAIFFYEHKTILAAHGAAMIWAPFAQSCSAIIQIYPKNYYPFGFYEPLIRESGSMSITWWHGLTIGDENNVTWLNAFKLHHGDRGVMRAQNIEISTSVLYNLLSVASTGKNECDTHMELLTAKKSAGRPVDSNAVGLPNFNTKQLTHPQSRPPCIEETVTLHTCLPSDAKYKACSVKDTIDVVLTVWKRASLRIQLEDIARQTKNVSHVWIVQNENHVEGVKQIVEQFKGTHPEIPIDIVNFSQNSKFHGRFHIGYFMSSAEYVSVWDDDVRVGNKWLEYSMSESKKHGNALVGGNGRIITSISPFKQANPSGAENDFVGHVWTLQRELIRYFIGNPQYTYVTGEDMQISFALQKHGIISWSPKHHADGRYVKDIVSLRSDSHASYLKGGGRERLWLVCTLVYNGFKTLQCTDCKKSIAAKCIEQF